MENRQEKFDRVDEAITEFIQDDSLVVARECVLSSDEVIAIINKAIDAQYIYETSILSSDG